MCAPYTTPHIEWCWRPSTQMSHDAPIHTNANHNRAEHSQSTAPHSAWVASTGPRVHPLGGVLARKSCGTKSRPPVDRCENACNARANISNNGEMFSRKSEMNLGRRWTARGPSFIPPPLVVKMREMKDYA